MASKAIVSISYIHGFCLQLNLAVEDTCNYLPEYNRFFYLGMMVTPNMCLHSEKNCQEVIE